jgi:hypothetical protein
MHPPLFRSTRTMSWDDIRVVSARCTTSKTNRYGGLVLQWADGTKLLFPLADKNGINRTLYERVQAMMDHRQYDYQGLNDVIFTLCPPGGLNSSPTSVGNQMIRCPDKAWLVLAICGRTVPRQVPPNDPRSGRAMTQYWTGTLSK